MLALVGSIIGILLLYCLFSLAAGVFGIVLSLIATIGGIILSNFWLVAIYKVKMMIFSNTERIALI